MADQIESIVRPGSAPPTNRASGPSVADTAGQEAQSLKDRAGEEASRVGHRAGDELGGLKDEAMEDARDLAGEARQRVGVEADRAAIEVAGALSDAGHELTTMAQRADHPDSPAAELVRRAGERARTTAQHLEQRGSQGVVDDISRFARNRPGLFLLGAAGLGFAVGRLVRNTDTGSIVDAARNELSAAGPTGSSAAGTPPGPAIDLRDMTPESGGVPPLGPAAGMPGTTGRTFP